MRRVGATLAFVASTLAPCEAGAQWAAGLDGSAVKRTEHSEWGGAVDVRFGIRFGLPRAFIIHTVAVQPELIVGYLRLPPWDADVTAVRTGGGGRVGFLLGYVEPFFVGHFSLAEAGGSWGYLGDGGLVLDWRFPDWSLGAHWTRDWLHAAGATEAFDEFGLHFEARRFSL